MLKGQENRSNYREYELREVNLILPNLVSLVDLKKLYIFKRMYWEVLIRAGLLKQKILKLSSQILKCISLKRNLK